VEFFGIPASTARGPALFAIRSGAPMLLATAERLPGWSARYLVRIEELQLPDTGDVDHDARELTRRYLANLEKAIIAAPEQYFWPHKRWKTRPPPEDRSQEPHGAGSV
jgi:Kdo2-lipid IVA lauroyltransferase/acyltransferase